MSYRNSGLTLLEVMFALLISLSLLATLTHLYLQAHRQLLTQQKRIELLSSVNKVQLLLQDEISLAGNIGCRRLSEDYLAKGDGEVSLTSANALMVMPDSLTVRYQSPMTVSLVSASMPSELSVEAVSQLKAGQVMLVSDCRHAEIFRADSVRQYGNRVIIKTSEPLLYQYTAGAEVGAFIVRRYTAVNDLVREGINHRHDIIQKNIHDLRFSQDEYGVHIQFATHDQSKVEKWYGYAKTI